MNVIRTLARSVREYKKYSIATPLLMVIEVLMECIMPLVMSRMIDEMQMGAGMQPIVRYGVILIVLTVISLAAGTLAARTCAIAGAGFAKNLRKDMYYNIQTFSFGDIDRFSVSSLITRMTTDVFNVREAYQMLIRSAVRTPLMLIFSLAMSFTINARVSLVFLAIVPFFAFGLILIISKAHPIFVRIFNTYDDMNNSVEENIRGIRVVKSFARESFEQDKFYSRSDKVRADFTRAEKLMALYAPMMQLAVLATLLLLSYFGAGEIVSSGGTTLTTGGLGSLITYALQIMGALLMMSVCVIFVVIAQESSVRIAEVINAETTLRDPDDPITELAGADITFRNVSFSYSSTCERPSLSDIDLSIAAGETVGIIGGTGSGKTTLTQLIPRLYDVTEGCVEIGGIDVRRYSLETLRNGIAMVLQKNVLFSGTIAENLRWGDPSATDEQLIEAARTAQAHEFIMAHADGYDRYIEQGGANVSGGQKQRLCIARALLKKPRILILDDSTSAVDTRTDALIRKAFREKLPDTTKIIIAQRVASIMDSDHIVIMDGGRIAAYGTHDELMRDNDIYRELYESQTKAVAEGGNND